MQKKLNKKVSIYIITYIAIYLQENNKNLRMIIMEISKRLSVIVDMIDKDSSIADIGTDHAYVPIEAVKKGISTRAIASDINRGPIEKARDNVKRNNLHGKIECRLGPGLSTINPGEVEGGIIAGMGGNLIRDIIEKDLEVFKKMDFLIAQPTQNPEIFRKYVYENGYEIIDEELCFDEGIYYEYIKIKYSPYKKENLILSPYKKENLMDSYDDKILDEIDYEISSILLKKKHELIGDYIRFKIEKYKKISTYINEDTESSIRRKRELKSKIEKMEEMLKCL